MMRINDHTGRLMRWRSVIFPLRFSIIYFIIIHCPGHKHQAPGGACRLRQDTEHKYPADGDEILTFADATVLDRVHVQRDSKERRPRTTRHQLRR